jgi:hypothetical protein
VLWALARALIGRGLLPAPLRAARAASGPRVLLAWGLRDPAFGVPVLVR